MKVGIAGTGFMGKTHAKCYNELPGIDIYAVADSNKNKAQEFSEIAHPVKIYNDVFDMINDPDIDIIDICLPTPLHMSAAVAALENNKHVLMEKPIALNINDAHAIKAAADKSNSRIMIAHVLRFWSEYISIKNILNHQMNGEDIISVYASRYNELPLWSENTWIMNEDSSGGLIIDLMIHDIDFFCWVFGMPKKVCCNAVYNDKKFAIQVMAILEMHQGTKVYIDGGYLNPSGCGLTTQVRIYGSNSLIEKYPGKNTIILSQKGIPSVKITPGKFDGYTEEIRYFIDCVEHKKEIKTVTLDDAINSLKVCIALRESLELNNWVNLK